MGRWGRAAPGRAFTRACSCSSRSPHSAPTRCGPGVQGPDSGVQGLGSGPASHHWCFQGRGMQARQVSACVPACMLCGHFGALLCRAWAGCPAADAHCQPCQRMAQLDAHPDSAVCSAQDPPCGSQGLERCSTLQLCIPGLSSLMPMPQIPWEPWLRRAGGLARGPRGAAAVAQLRGAARPPARLGPLVCCPPDRPGLRTARARWARRACCARRAEQCTRAVHTPQPAGACTQPAP